MAPSDLSIPEGSWVLITGVTGWVASHTALQFLERGYRVRGTVRDRAAASWVVEHPAFKPYADKGDLELVVVPDMAADRAFDGAVGGCSAVLHVATITSPNPDPEQVVPPTVAGTVSLLRAAAREPWVKRFVYTGSIAAQTMLVPGNDAAVTAETWNDEAVRLAYAPPVHPAVHLWSVYASSKVAAEKALWRFVEEEKPGFVANVISPASIIGAPLDAKHASGAWVGVGALYQAQPEKLGVMSVFPAGLAVDVKDIALLHVAATLDPSVRGERLAAWGQRTTWNDLLAILRRLRPARAFPPDFADPLRVGVTTDQSRTVELLKLWGRDGWTPLEASVEDNIKALEALE